MYKYLLCIILISSLDSIAVEPIATFNHNDGQKLFSVAGLQFTADGESLLTVGNGTKLWDVNTWQISMSTQEVGANQVFFLKDSSLMLADMVPGGFSLIDVNLLEIIGDFQGHEPFQGSGRNAHPTVMFSAAISDNNRFLVTEANDQKAVLWDVDSKVILKRFCMIDPETGEPTGFDIAPVIFSPNSELVGFGNVFWSTSTFTKKFELEDSGTQRRHITSVTFIPSSKYFVTSAIDGFLRIWDWDRKQGNRMKYISSECRREVS